MEFSRRKWGWYLTVYSARYFKIKFLYFKKGGECSNQMHSTREETWLFLFGSGSFLSGQGIAAAIAAGDAAYVPARAWHQYKALKPTLVLEIQTGICREDDIERR